jgi:hypothetical protein
LQVIEAHQGAGIDQRELSQEPEEAALAPPALEPLSGPLRIRPVQLCGHERGSSETNGLPGGKAGAREDGAIAFHADRDRSPRVELEGGEGRSVAASIQRLSPLA